MKRNTRNRKSGLPANVSSSKTSEHVDIDEDEHHESDLDIVTPQSKKAKTAMVCVSPAFQKRYEENGLATRVIITGKPIASKLIPSLRQCGILKILDDVELETFFLDMPKYYYPDFVREFYANLSTDKFGSTVTVVGGKKIVLNPPIFHSIFKMENTSDIDVFTSLGNVNVPDFPIADQMKTLFGNEPVVNVNPIPTTAVCPLAHLLFKLARSHLCPRLGSKSTLSCQDIVVVSMILAGRQFDVGELILKKMHAVIEKVDQGLPYALVLTRVFEFFKLDFKNTTKVVMKDFLDHKYLALSNLQFEDDTLVRILPAVQDFDTGASLQQTTATETSGSIPQMVTDVIQDNHIAMIGRMTTLAHDVEEIKADLRDCICELKVIKAVMKSMKDMLQQGLGNKSSTAFSDANQTLEEEAKDDNELEVDKSASGEKAKDAQPDAKEE